jgi:hypothetical protein
MTDVVVVPSRMDGTLLQTVIDAVFPSWLPRFVKAFIITKVLEKLVEVGGKALGKAVKRLTKKAEVGSIADLDQYILALASLADDFASDESVPSVFGEYIRDGLDTISAASVGEFDLRVVPCMKTAAFFREHGFPKTASEMERADRASEFLIGRNQLMNAWGQTVEIGLIRSIGAVLNKVMKVRMAKKPIVSLVRYQSMSKAKTGVYMIRFGWEVTGFRGEHTAKDAIDLVIELDKQGSERWMHNKRQQLEDAAKDIANKLKREEGEASSDEKKEAPVPKRDRSGYKWTKVLGTTTWDKTIFSSITSKRAAISLSMTPANNGKLIVGLNLYFPPTSARALANVSSRQFKKEGDSNIISGLEQMARTWIETGTVVQGQLDRKMFDSVIEVANSFRREWGIKDITPTHKGIAIIMDAMHGGTSFWSRYIDFDPGKDERRQQMVEIGKQVKALESERFAMQRRKRKGEDLDDAELRRKHGGPDYDNFASMFMFIVTHLSVPGTAERLDMTNEQVRKWYSLMERNVKITPQDDLLTNVKDLAKELWEDEREEIGSIDDVIGDLNFQIEKLKSPGGMRDELSAIAVDQLQKDLAALKSEVKDQKSERRIDKITENIKLYHLYVKQPAWKEPGLETRKDALFELKRKINALLEHYGIADKGLGRSGRSFLEDHFRSTIILEANGVIVMHLEQR